MSEGSYRSMDLGELTAAFEHLGPQAQLFRPVLDVGDEPDRIFQAFVGPTEVSTCVGLVPAAHLPIWDVNGYYRALGVSWPYRPTKPELLRGYLAANGQAKPYATYAFKQLLDREFRRHYDRRPLGEPVDDPFRFQEVFQMASEMAARQSKLLGKVVTYRQLLGDDLFDRMEAEAEAERQADLVAAKRLEREMESGALDAQDREPTPDVPFEWPYSYYLWNSRKFDDLTLSQWQEMLIRSCAAQGLSFHLAVGYCRTPGEATRKWHIKPDGGGVEIIFLREDVVPSQELADVVVGTYHTHAYGQLARPLHL